MLLNCFAYPDSGLGKDAFYQLLTPDKKASFNFKIFLFYLLNCKLF